MPLKRKQSAVLLAIALSLAVPAAHARKDDEDNGGRKDKREQRYEQRGAAADNGRNRVQREDRRPRQPEASGARRNQQPERRYTPEYQRRPAQPHETVPRRAEPRRYEPAPRYDAPAYPQERSAPGPDYGQGYAPRGMSLSEAVSQAERRSGGRVLSAEPGDDGGQPYYRIKVLSPNGRVQILYIDAN